MAFAPGITNDATLVIPANTVLPSTIAGFSGTLEAINLVGLAYSASTSTTAFNARTYVLSVTSGTIAVQLQLDSEAYTGVHFAALQNAGGGTQIVALPQPTVTSVTTSPASGKVGVKAVVTFTVNFSAPVTVTGGKPTLLLSDGGTASYTGGTGKSALTFVYTVVGGDTSPDLTVTGTALNGAVIQRGGGNLADLSGAVTNPPGILVVDTTIPAKIVNKTTVDLHGAHTQYLIADNNGSLYLQDTVSGRDGTPTLPGVTTMVFTDGTGIFDHTGTAEDIARLYRQAFGRGPDVAGLQYWTAQADTSHVPLSTVASVIAASPEFIKNNGTLTDAAFVDQLYLNLRGQAEAPSEATFWTGLLAAGTSRSTVLLDFAESQEGDAAAVSTEGDVANAEVTRLYRALLDRAPGSDGMAYWAAALDNGMTPAGLAQAIVASPEFQQGMGTLDASDFVTALYQNALQRVADAAGTSYWVGQMQQGVSQATVGLNFADGLESRLLTLPTHASWVFIPT